MRRNLPISNLSSPSPGRPLLLHIIFVPLNPSHPAQNTNHDLNLSPLHLHPRTPGSRLRNISPCLGLLHPLSLSSPRRRFPLTATISLSSPSLSSSNLSTTSSPPSPSHRQAQETTSPSPLSVIRSLQRLPSQPRPPSPPCVDHRLQPSLSFFVSTHTAHAQKPIPQLGSSSALFIATALVASSHSISRSTEPSPSAINSGNPSLWTFLHLFNQPS
ncbi:hypothetical protein MRB53_002160 [Persea americana]|uniref:Uncharacterized protein n=1 Tax=Persea americana TaxID=3435 RepID=A0ACC2MTL9_PERAE|nr:hypothetical protein MRB53_002160 [Persea americana]